jgi:Reverse transcriptase (RNA-dependent DNA polymerase)
LRVGIDQVALYNAVQFQDLSNPDCQTAQHDQQRLSEHAFRVVQFGFGALDLQQLKIKDNIAHSVRSTPHLIVLRCLNQLIRQSVKIEPSDRDTIIRRLATVLQEGVPHRIYKFDIKAFFDSVDCKELFGQIANEIYLPRSGALVLQNFLNELANRNIRGLPRGIPLSATLSEYLMKKFDDYVSRLPDVYYYARYVDDIIIVTGMRENKNQFAREIRKHLPPGLQFNTAKTTMLDVAVQLKSNGVPAIGNFDYLGYNFSVHETKRVDGRLSRSIAINLSAKKIRRIKFRICCALASFITENDMKLLERHMQPLTGNYNLRDLSTGRIRNAGLYCNYRRANSYTGLHELDSFLRSIFVGKHLRLARRLSSQLSLNERRALLRFSFKTSFDLRTFYNFPPSELAKLTLCWRDA